MHKTALILNRQGYIRTKVTQTNQCKSPGHTIYHYLVRLTCLPHLDESGFIIDHADIGVAIENLGKGPKGVGSCEQLVNRILDTVVKKLEAHGADWTRVHVTLKPTTTEPVLLVARLPALDTPAWMEGERTKS